MQIRIERWAMAVAVVGLLWGCGGGGGDSDPSTDTGSGPNVVTCAVNADCSAGEFCSATAEANLKFPKHLEKACIDEASMECFMGNCTESGMCTKVGDACVPTNDADCLNSADCANYNSCVFEGDACLLPAGSETDTSNPNTPKPGECAAPQPDTPAGCGFDSSKQGKSVGDHVKNYGLKTWEKCAHYLHQDCGGETKAIWLILSTGW